LITLNPELMERINNITWFQHIGEIVEPPPPIKFIQIPTWDEAPIYLHSDAWTDAKLEASNALSAFLSRYHKAEDRKWNILAAASREFLKNEVEAHMLPIAQAHKLTKVFLTTVQWCLLGALLEDAYKECNPPVRFFTDLLDIYEAGHFPCGWVEGKWPEGKLVVL